MKKLFFAGSANGEAPAGLRVFEFDTASGAIKEVNRVEKSENPGYLAISSNGLRLYAAQQVAPGANGWRGGIVVYKVEGAELEKLAEYSCAPSVPCHISLSNDGKKLAWAEYSGAWAGVFDIDGSGLLSGTACQVNHEGSGPNKSRQEAAHCHYAAFTPDDATVCICDLGIDRVVCYSRDCQDGKMVEVEGAGYTTKPGAGPRHMAFHPNGKFVFLLNELDSTLVSLRNLGGGALTEIGTYPTLPRGFIGESKSAAVKVSPNGKWVLASNRGNDSIAAFLIDEATGQLERTAVSPLTGRFPRDFEFSPDGKFVVVGHKLSDEIAVYSFDDFAGELERTKNVYRDMVKPLCFVFAKE
ncbi:MAG: lactonase family protein [Lentisphaerae bacterium]|jgi:6-phosphogluconolactonase|nr:lactonase family protein [Lentisphaerota bacterium]